jgi:hypothetical protein
MGDVMLSTGLVTIDKSQVKHGEWTKFATGKGTIKEDALFIEKVSGIKADAQDEMLQEDYRYLVKGIVTAMTEPLADPNLASPSTKE